jgi:hypothetical protein
MEQFFGFRNFRQFERSRKEIRLPYDLLNDMRFRQLPDARKAHLICPLLLSARMDNLLPNNPIKLEQLIGATDSVDLSAFADFVAFARLKNPITRTARRRDGFPTPSGRRCCCATARGAAGAGLQSILKSITSFRSARAGKPKSRTCRPSAGGVIGANGRSWLLGSDCR